MLHSVFRTISMLAVASFIAPSHSKAQEQSSEYLHSKEAVAAKFGRKERVFAIRW